MARARKLLSRLGVEWACRQRDQALEHSSGARCRRLAPELPERGDKVERSTRLTLRASMNLKDGADVVVVRFPAVGFGGAERAGRRHSPTRRTRSHRGARPDAFEGSRPVALQGDVGGWDRSDEPGRRSGPPAFRPGPPDFGGIGGGLVVEALVEQAAALVVVAGPGRGRDGG